MTGRYLPPSGNLEIDDAGGAPGRIDLPKTGGIESLVGKGKVSVIERIDHR